MAKKMLSLEEIETQLVLELPDRQLMRAFDRVIGRSGATPGFALAAKAPDTQWYAKASDMPKA